jgi:hypothetical protein
MIRIRMITGEAIRETGAQMMTDDIGDGTGIDVIAGMTVAGIEEIDLIEGIGERRVVLHR